MRSEQLPPFGALPPQTRGPQVRDRRWRWAFWILLPIQIVVFVAGVCLVALPILAGTQPTGSALAFQRVVARPLGLEWVVQYNYGTHLAANEHWEEAITSLEDAYGGVPKATAGDEGEIQAYTYECSVRFNLSAAWEGYGDSLREAEQALEADAAYATALDWVGPCELDSSNEDPSQEPPEAGDNPQPQAGDNSESGDNPNNSDRLRQKRQQVNPQQEDQPEDQNQETDSSEKPDTDGNPFSGETPDEQRRREELQQRKNDQQEQDRERDESYHRNPSVGGW